MVEVFTSGTISPIGTGRLCCLHGGGGKDATLVVDWAQHQYSRPQSQIAEALNWKNVFTRKRTSAGSSELRRNYFEAIAAAVALHVKRPAR